ncbi:sulfite exporter TauE/SafE family protein [Pseudolysinimonas sp.]|uniref:sulfite exporter TauE/SafE family protein n=1 Tax=Pseudolysinimonas sp. TaxID=2680009 RepID=UPI00286B7514|nr:sulfite exporter TauE/SafE family protein [Pseudolysinimonas sp.]
MTSPTAPASDRPTVRHILLLVLVGAIGGTFSGALGVGGGIVMVPLLLMLLKFDQRRAAATSLAAIVLSSISGAATYGVAGHTDVVAGLLLGAGGVAGSLIGTRLLKVLPIAILRWGFIALLVVIAVRMLLVVPDRGADIEYSVAIGIGLVASGVVMGILAGLFGIGGGVLIVPLLVAGFGVSDLIAKGTSLLAMIPTSITGSIANVRNQLVRPLDGLIIGGTALLASLGGAAIAFIMPPWLSAVLFGLFVAATAIQLTIRAIRQHRTPPVG